MSCYAQISPKESDMKKFLSLLIACLMVLSALCLVACDEEEEGNNTNLPEASSYELKDANGKILGTLDYSAKGTDFAIITKYTPRVTEEHDVVIPDVVGDRTVVGIGDSAFYASTYVKSLSIPSTVETIGKMAFYSCDSIETLELPDALISIGDYAFQNCTSLKSVNFTDVEDAPIQSIGDFAFCGCEALTEISIPEGVETLGNGAFFNCTGLTKVTAPESLKSIGDGAFGGCSGLGTDAEDEETRISVVLGSGIESMGKHVFGDIPAANISYPEGSTTDKTINPKKYETETDSETEAA